MLTICIPIVFYIAIFAYSQNIKMPSLQKLTRQTVDKQLYAFPGEHSCRKTRETSMPELDGYRTFQKLELSIFADLAIATVA